MDMQTLRRPLLVVLSALGLTLSGAASAEPPSRAARLGYMSGTVSFSPAGQPDWVQAVVNRPLTTGDRLWVDANSRAELQIGGAAIRLGSNTSATLLNLDDRIAQVQLTQGSLKVRVRHLGPDQSFEVDTPNLAFTLRRPGEYRIDVDSNDDATAVVVQSGEAEVYGEDASYAITPRQGYRFYGTGLSDYDPLGGRRDDELDRWARERDLRADNSPSARYVSGEVVGYEDLDANGTWRSDPSYGNVWTPTRVAAGWTPYHDGHWAWVDPWGWTWVDDAPWGFAVSHYGRWANFNGTWGWVPGPPREQAVYAPALVAFVGGRNFQVSVSVGSVAAAVGWFPLAPREVYQPSYPVSRGYFDNINRSNAVIAPTTITNVYNTTNITNTTIVNNTTKVVYVNQQVTGAVVAVPAQAFAQSQSVARAAVQLPKEVALSAPVAQVASVAPLQQSVHGGAPVVLAKPPARELAVVAHTAPPPPPVPFIEQQKHLAANPGKPIDEAQRVQLKPAVLPGPEAKVSVIAAARAPAPAAPPPATPPAPKTPEARKVDAAKAEAAVVDRKPDEARAAAARADAAKADAARIEGAKADAAKAAAAGAATAKADLARAEAAKADATRNETAKADAANAETARAAAAKGEAAKAEAVKAEAARIAAATAGAAKADAAKAEAMKAESARASAAKAEAAKAEAAQADAKAAAAKAEASRADATRAEAARIAAATAGAAKADAAKAEAMKAESARASVAKAEAAQADAKAAAAKAEASRADATRAEATRAEATRAEAARAEAARAETARAETARAVAAKADAARAGAAQADAARAKAEASRAEAARAESARAEGARAAAAKAEAARVEAAQAEAAKATAARAEAARAEAARAEAARAAQAKPPAPPAQHASSPRPGADAKG